MATINLPMPTLGANKPMAGAPKLSSTSNSPRAPAKSTTLVPQASGFLSRRSASPTVAMPLTKTLISRGSSRSTPPEKLTSLLHCKNSEKYLPFILVAIPEEDRNGMEGYTLDYYIHYGMSHFGKWWPTKIWPLRAHSQRSTLRARERDRGGKEEAEGEGCHKGNAVYSKCKEALDVANIKVTSSQMEIKKLREDVKHVEGKYAELGTKADADWEKAYAHGVAEGHRSFLSNATGQSFLNAYREELLKHYHNSMEFVVKIVVRQIFGCVLVMFV